MPTIAVTKSIMQSAKNILLSEVFTGEGFCCTVSGDMIVTVYPGLRAKNVCYCPQR